jgi:hypothetical protein
MSSSIGKLRRWRTPTYFSHSRLVAAVFAGDGTVGHLQHGGSQRGTTELQRVEVNAIRGELLQLSGRGILPTIACPAPGHQALRAEGRRGRLVESIELAHVLRLALQVARLGQRRTRFAVPA